MLTDQTNPAPLAAVPTLSQIMRLQEELKAFPQAEIPPIHNFGPGYYSRSLNIPAGTIAVGKMHAKEHLFMLTKGEMLVVTEDGAVLVKAPHMSVCRPGLKRAVVALTDVCGTNIHITDSTDIDQIERELILPDALLNGTESLQQIGGVSCG